MSARPEGRRPEVRERGAGTVLVLAVVMLAAALAAGAVVVGRAVADRHRAAAAADLAALAAAGDPVWPSCARARSVAVANGAALVACTPLPDAAVEVEVVVPTVGGRAARGRARAGPAPD